MDDLISRQAAIERAENVAYAVDEHGSAEGWLAMLVNSLEILPSAQPDWIPVSKRLPDMTALVTVETKVYKHRYVCEAVWIPRWSKKAEYDNWEDCSEYNEDEDEYYVLEGWYERVHNWDEYSYVGIEDDVIAWMPLPESYKGEQE